MIPKVLTNFKFSLVNHTRDFTLTRTHTQDLEDGKLTPFSVNTMFFLSLVLVIIVIILQLFTTWMCNNVLSVSVSVKIYSEPRLYGLGWPYTANVSL